MKSIRLSLTVYFLVLLGLALSAGLGLLYQTMRQTLQEKTESRRYLLQVQYDIQTQQLDKEFDGHLLHRAQVLASLAQSQWTHSNPRQYYALGLLTAVPSPQAHLITPLWLGEALEGPFSGRLRRISFMKINFAEDVMPREGDARAQSYFQVYNEQGISLQHSQSMGEESFSLDPALHGGLKLYVPVYDTTQLGDTPVRRVTIKTPIARMSTPERSPRTARTFRAVRPPNSSPESNREGGERITRSSPGAAPRPERPRGRREWNAPAIFIQCAVDTSQRDATLAGYRAQLNKDLDQSTAEASESLSRLRTRLLWIGGATFALTLIGSYWLVGLGLSPLRRLSEAVSRVSERDMTLHCKPAQLPPELRPIADRLVQTLALLQRAFARERQAAADISHELRTPLAALLTTLEVGLRRQRSPEEYTELLKDCHAIGQQMTQLVERLLALARIDAGVDAIRPQEVDVVNLARQCVSLVRPLAEARNLTLELHCQESKHLLHTDPGKLREVLTNLLHNAVDYNRPNGRIAVNVARENGTLRLSVADTGIGISPRDQAHIFERFFRADPSRSAEGLHAGVGLSIVKGYVELMGGTIAVDSREGEGSTFRLALPVV